MEKLKTVWKSWMANKKSKRIVLAISGIVAILVVAGLCVLFYWLGANSRDNEEDKSASKKEVVLSDDRDDKDKNKDKDDENTAVSGDAVSGGAVSADGVTVSGVAADAGDASGSTTDSQKQSDSSTSGNKGSGSSNSGQKGSGNAGGSTAGNSAGSAATSGYAGKLSVSGNRLMANGSPIQLRGVSTHGLSWFPEYVNSAMFGELKSWGANTVRLAMYTAEYNGYCTGDGANRTKLKELIKKGVQYATEQGMYVIIDWHILSDNNPNTYKSEAIAFFTEMAQTYKDNDHVIYEICNEPNGGTSWSEIKRYANEVIPAIRQHDPDGVILVGTPTWSQELDKAVADPITGYNNIMYTLHFYANTHRESLRNTLTTAVNAGLPVFVSEFSICDASGNGGINTEQANQWIQTLNSHGVSYVAWSLSNKAETSALIQSSCSKTSGITEGDLSECGKWLLQTLQGKISTQTATSQNGAGGQNSQNSQNNSNNNQNQSSNQSGASGNQGGQANVQKNPASYTPTCSGGTQVTVSNSWQEGNAFCIQYDVKVSNTTGQAQNDWKATLTFPANATVVSGWNANFTASGKTVTLTPMDYNKNVAAGGSVEGIGCIIKFE